MKKNLLCNYSNKKPEIYTDGSVMNNKMAIGVWSKDYNIHSSLKLKGRIDSNRAELAAIFYAMLRINNKCEDIKILTDSLISLKLIRNEIDCNNKYEILVDSIKFIKNTSKGMIDFAKVKSHSKNIGNDNADYLAKFGNTSMGNIKTLILPDDIIPQNEYNKHDISDILYKILDINDIY